MTAITTREGWGARPPKSTVALTMPTKALYLHHAAGGVLPGDNRLSNEDLRRIRSIQNYHMDVRGWADIAYHYLVDPDGNILEGRGAGVKGGATLGQNSVSHAICVMGNYEIQHPEPPLLEALTRLVVYGHASGWWPLGFTGGHRDAPGASTSCPGRYLYAQLPALNKKIREVNMSRFLDVPDDHPHHDAIEWLAQNGITQGCNPPDNTMFCPDRPVTREEFATLLKRYHDGVGADH